MPARFVSELVSFSIRNMGATTMAKAKKTKTVYELKVMLAGIRPPIWRRIRTLDCTLLTLSEIIQNAMGWENAHLWVFEIGDEQYGETPMGDPIEDMMNPRSLKLSELVNDGVTKFRYTYDFGDNWDHRITIEKTLDADPAYPAIA